MLGGLTHNRLRSLTYRNRFEDYLPWLAYDPKESLYHNTDGTFGRAWECTPFTFMGEKSAAVLDGLCRAGFPEGSVMQFVLYGDPDISRYLSAYTSLKTLKDPLFTRATETFTRFLSDGTSGLSNIMGNPIRNYRVFMSIKIPGLFYNNEFQREDFFRNIEEILRGADLFPRNLPPEQFLFWLRQIFNENSVNGNLYDTTIPIRKQVILSETVIEKDMRQLRIGNKLLRCITPKVFPKTVDPMQTNRLFGGIDGLVSDADQYPTAFLYGFNVVFGSLHNVLHAKCNLVLQQQGVGSFAPSLKRKQEEYLWATDQLEGGKKFVQIIPILWLWDNDEGSLSETVSRARRIWESQGYIMQEDRGILPILFISALPFGLYNIDDNLKNLDRDFIVPSDVVPPLLPVQSDFSGGGDPMLLLLGRKGQICSLDIFDKRVPNHNVFIAASSGGGKSFFVNGLAYNYFVANSIIRIIDIGGSYRKMANIFKGRFIDFSENSGVCINPFSSVLDIYQDGTVLSSIILQMIYSATDLIPVDQAESSAKIVQMAVRIAWEREGNKASIDTVYAILRDFSDCLDKSILKKEKDQLNQIAKGLAFNLTEFTSGGVYGKWFNGPSTLDISTDEFVVLELENLKQRKDLFKVVTLQIINAVTQDLYLSDRFRNRFVIFDEAWQFLRDGDLIADVIEEGYRRARKYRGSFTVITQSIMDLKNFGRVGSVILSNSAFKFMMQSPDFEKAKEEKLIDYDPFVMHLLNGLRSNKPHYSEIFMDTPFGLGITRLVVDPFSYYIYTSDAAEVAEIDDMVNKGMTYAEAISKMVIKYRS